MAERRVCSLLFADLVGFTPVAEGRDPEEVRELLSGYFDSARTVVARYGGVVEKFIGDAVMAVWGAPVAEEGDAERSVRAGLELVDHVAGLGSDLGIPELAVRVGVTTGDTAVTIGMVGEGMVAGDAVNTAARIQTSAAPGEVWVDEATRRLAEASIGFEDRGEHRLKGKAEPVRVWRATRVLAGLGGVQRIDGLEAPMFGRDAELRTVKELFHAAEQRRTPRLVLVTGPVGAGKSRLGWEFEKYVDGLRDKVWWHRGRCLAYGDGVAFWALAEIVRQRFGIADDDPVDVAADRLSEGLPRFVPDSDERAFVGARLGRLLGVPVNDDEGPTTPLASEELFAGWRLFFERLTAEHPVALLVEDAQHADPGLLDFLDYLIDWARDVPIFVLVFARHELLEMRPGFGTGRNRSTLALDPLDARSLDQLLDALVPGMPDGVRELLARRAQGNPLFAVETVRALIDRDVVVSREGQYQLVDDPGDLEVPDSLRGLLASRLDGLGEELRSLVAHAAVLGSTFEEAALAAISHRPVEQVRPGLAELIRREVLTVITDPLSPEKGDYAFGQDMLRQVAYETLSRRDRKALHLAVAEYLRREYPNDAEEVAEVLAQQYLAALSAVPDAPDADPLREQAVAALLRSAERSTRAGATRSASRAYARAAELAESSDAMPNERAAGWWEKAANNDNLAADFEVAIAHARRSAELFAQLGRPRDVARCQATMGRALGRLGHHSEAREILNRAIAALRPDPDADTVKALSELSGLEAMSRGPEGPALTMDALDLAQSLDVDNTLVAELFNSLGLANLNMQRVHEALAALEYAAQLAEHADDRSLRGLVLLNLAEVLIPIDPERAATVAHDACEQARLAGDRDDLGYAYANLAMAFIETGQWEEAQKVLETEVESENMADAEVVHVYRCFLLALRGEATAAMRFAALPGMRASEDPQDLASAALCDAFIAVAEGRTKEALGCAQAILEHVDSLGVRAESVRWGWPIAARLALKLGETAIVEELLAILEARAVGHIPRSLKAAQELVQAEVAAARGDPDAQAAFTRAVTALEQAGNPYHHAGGLLDYAEFLAGTDRADDAAQLRTQAREIAEVLGCKPLTARLPKVDEQKPG